MLSLSAVLDLIQYKEVKIDTYSRQVSSKSNNILKELRLLEKLCHICVKDNSKYIAEEERTK